MFKIIVFVPRDQKDLVKNALFNAGAGKIGNYDCCCFESIGTGPFRPLPGSDPFLGSVNKIEKVNEIKLEMVCTKEKIKDAIAAMKKAHPYEEVAYDIIKLETAY